MLGLPALAQWQVQDSKTDAAFRGVATVSENVGWVSGTKGTVLRTLDGGQHWENVSVAGAETLDFRDIQAWNAQDATVLSSGPGDKSRIYRTTDGGKHWRLLFTNPEPKAFYDGSAFWDRKHGIAMSDPVDGHFLLLSTQDGEHWTPLTPRSLPPSLPDEGGFAASGTCIIVNGPSDLWFVTSAARVFHSPDKGQNWTVTDTPMIHGKPPQGIFSIAFANAQHGVIVGGDYEKPKVGEKNVAFTSDGGKTWVLSEENPLGYRSAVAFVPGTNPVLWITVGTSGSDVSVDGGKTWRRLDAENYNAVGFSRSGAGWAVGPKGKIARFEHPRYKEP